MTRLSKPVATIETLKRLVTNSDSKYATKDSLSTVATTGNYSDLKGTPTSLPANGGNASTVNGHTVLSNVPANAKFTDTVYTHPNSGVTAGTYKSVTVNAQGHVTAGTNPTTLSGYGITDAKISNGVITLGANSITPLTNHQSLANYYTKSEVNSHISSIPKFAIAVVTDLPTSNISNTTIYLKKTGDDTQNLYTEYIYVNSKWEQLGTQKLDLSGYLTKTDASNTYLGKTATAANASKLVLDQGTANTARPVIFQDSNLSTSVLTACYNNKLTYNPETNNLVVGTINGFTLNSSVPANAKFTDTVYTHPSTHPASMINGLAKVATSGSYNDLSNKPTIPASLPANGGAATTATKLTVNAGSATVPTYFTNGVPTACTGISVATVTATTTLNIPGGKIWIE